LWKHEAGRAGLVPDITNDAKCLTNVRLIFNVFSYLNHATVNEYMTATCNDIRTELKRADEAWMKGTDIPDKKSRPTRASTGIVDYWDKWIRSHFKTMVSKGKSSAEIQLLVLRQFWEQERAEAEEAEDEDRQNHAMKVLADVQLLNIQLNNNIIKVKVDDLL
jgi:hypothetical protein